MLKYYTYWLGSLRSQRPSFCKIACYRPCVLQFLQHHELTFVFAVPMPVAENGHSNSYWCFAPDCSVACIQKAEKTILWLFKGSLDATHLHSVMWGWCRWYSETLDRRCLSILTLVCMIIKGKCWGVEKKRAGLAGQEVHCIVLSTLPKSVGRVCHVLCWLFNVRPVQYAISLESNRVEINKNCPLWYYVSWKRRVIRPTKLSTAWSASSIRHFDSNIGTWDMYRHC